MSNEQVENQINSLKKAFGAETDGQLAKALDVGRSTVASWRLRGSVPTRYLLRAPGFPKGIGHLPICEWSSEETHAVVLALLRLTHGKGELFDSYRSYLHDHGQTVIDFLGELETARSDILRLVQDDEGVSADTAAATLAYTVFHPDK